MRIKLLDLLACPHCHHELTCEVAQERHDHDIVSGLLSCSVCSARYPIRDSIPRFVESDDYSTSFGFQWNKFRLEQVDSDNHSAISAQRFYSETGWTGEWLANKWILDAGCGAGRFLDVASLSGCEVVGIDLSTAVDAAAKTLHGRANVHLIQASLFKLPFRNAAFDGVCSIGVIQHTPDPRRALKALPRVLRPGGRVAVTVYERKPWTKLNSKYLLRPLTKRLPSIVLLRIIQMLMPFLFPITEFAFRIPCFGRFFAFVIPVANYVDQKDLTIAQRYQWALLDTFDMFSPAYDHPQTESEVESALAAGGIADIKRLRNPGVNLVGARS